MKRIARSALVGQSAARMYALVEDIEAYPEFLPWCLEARVHERTPDTTRATLVVGMRGLRQSFTTLNRNLPGESIAMTLVEGPFRAFAGTWTFRALSPEAARIEFILEYEFASRAAARLLEPLFERMADTMVDAFARRAEVSPRTTR
jgi:ribosome-associated toxin RatA of RatAB toxin-antitoxin module